MLREIADINVVVPMGQQVVDFNGLITLNESGTFLWKKLQKNISRDELIKSLLEEYEVTLDTATNDVDEFIQALKNRDIIIHE